MSHTKVKSIPGESRPAGCLNIASVDITGGFTGGGGTGVDEPTGALYGRGFTAAKTATTGLYEVTLDNVPKTLNSITCTVVNTDGNLRIASLKTISTVTTTGVFSVMLYDGSATNTAIILGAKDTIFFRANVSYQNLNPAATV